MSSHVKLCPVCGRHVEPTRGKNIAGHLDKAGHPCPASYELPFDKAITSIDPTKAS